MPLRDNLTMKSSDLRRVLEIAAPTMNDIFKKLKTEFVGRQGKRAGAKLLNPVEVRKIFEMRGFQFPKKAEVISFVICKGGTGKSSSSLFTIQRLAECGAKILAIDTDPQGNLSSSFHLDRFDCPIDKETPVLVDIIAGDVPIKDAIIEYTDQIHLLPSSPLNSILEGKIREGNKNPSKILAKFLGPLKAEYDYIIIDCAPALNLTNTAVICFSDKLILPINVDVFSEIALEQTLNEIEEIRKDFDLSDIDVRIVVTKVDGREYVTNSAFLGKLVSNHSDMLLNTSIGASTDVKKVIRNGDDLYSLSKSRVKEDYDSFAREIVGLNNFKKKRPGASRKG